MIRLALIALTVAALFGADNPWLKVQQLPNRSELRIYKKGEKSPVNVILADVSEDKLVVVEKNKQYTIQKDEIDRLDARPVTPSKKTEATTTEKQNDPDYTQPPNRGPALPTTSSSSSLSFGNKPDFKTLYTRAK